MLNPENIIKSIDSEVQSIINFILLEYKGKPNKTFFEVESDLLNFNIDKYNILFPYNVSQDSIYKGKKITLKNKKNNFTIDVLNYLEISFICTFHFDNSMIQFSFNSDKRYHGYFYQNTGNLFDSPDFIIDHTLEYDWSGDLEEYLYNSSIEELSIEKLKFIHENINSSTQEIKESLFLKYDVFDEYNIELFIQELKKIFIYIEKSIKDGDL